MADSIQERLKIAVKSTNFKTLREISQKSGIPYITLQNYLGGKRLPGSEALIKLAKVGINPNYILLGEGPPILGEKKEVAVKKKSRILLIHPSFPTNSSFIPL